MTLLNQLMMMKRWQQTLGQSSWPGLPGVWRPALDSSFFLTALGVEAGEEERREGERGHVKRGGSEVHLDYQECR